MCEFPPVLLVGGIFWFFASPIRLKNTYHDAIQAFLVLIKHFKELRLKDARRKAEFGGAMLCQTRAKAEKKGGCINGHTMTPSGINTKGDSNNRLSSDCKGNNRMKCN